MLSKKGYLIHFTRIFFTGLLLSICSLLSYIWNKYQPFHLSIQLQRCQSNISHISIWNWLNNFHFIHLLPSLSKLTSSKCHLYIKDNYPLNIDKFIGLIHSILIVYLVYYLICFSLFHSHMKHIQNKQYYYAKLYRHDQKNSTVRCSNRLLKT